MNEQTNGLTKPKASRIQFSLIVTYILNFKSSSFIVFTINCFAQMERQTYVQTNGVSDLHQNFRSTADLHAEFEVYNSYSSWDSLSTKIFVQTNRRTNGQKYLFRNYETSIRSEMFEKTYRFKQRSTYIFVLSCEIFNLCSLILNSIIDVWFYLKEANMSQRKPII